MACRLAIAAYLLFFRKEARSLRVTMSEVLNRSMNTQPLQAGEGPGGVRQLATLTEIRATSRATSRFTVTKASLQVEEIDWCADPEVRNELKSLNESNRRLVKEVAELRDANREVMSRLNELSAILGKRASTMGGGGGLLTPSLVRFSEGGQSGGWSKERISPRQSLHQSPSRSNRVAPEVPSWYPEIPHASSPNLSPPPAEPRI